MSHSRSPELFSKILTVQVISEALGDKIDALTKMVNDTHVDPDSSYQVQGMVGELGQRLEGLRQYVFELQTWTKRLETTSHEVFKCSNTRSKESRERQTDIMVGYVAGRVKFHSSQGARRYIMEQAYDMRIQVDAHSKTSGDMREPLSETGNQHELFEPLVSKLPEGSLKGKPKTVRYSEDFKRSILKRIFSGTSMREASSEFKVGLSTIKRWKSEYEPVRKPQKKLYKPVKGGKLEERILEYVSAELKGNPKTVDQGYLLKEMARIIEKTGRCLQGQETTNLPKPTIRPSIMDN